MYLACDFALLADHSGLVSSCWLLWRLVGSSGEFIFENLDLIIALHNHRFLFLALCYFLSEFLFNLFYVFLKFLDFFVFTPRNLLILFARGLFFFEFCTHFFNLLFKLDHSITWLHLDWRRLPIKSFVEVLTHLPILILVRLVIIIVVLVFVGTRGRWLLSLGLLLSRLRLCFGRTCLVVG